MNFIGADLKIKKEAMKEEDICKLCGSPDLDKASDHLRTCYKISQDKLDSSMFKPRSIMYDEMIILERGFNTICNNRHKCIERQKANFKKATS